MSCWKSLRRSGLKRLKMNYCANQCPIGQQYVPEIKVKDLSQIILEMLASLNSMSISGDLQCASRLPVNFVESGNHPSFWR